MTFASAERRERWAPVHHQLQLWLDENRKAQMWLRDDDAVTVTRNLERLVDLCRPHGICPLIACVPKGANPELAAYLSASQVEAAMHGWSHANHQPAGIKAQEFPPHRGQAVILEELRQAVARLDNLFGGKTVPIYVPPWNRIDPEVAGLLPGLGFVGLSTFGNKRLLAEAEALKEINTHVDIIDWAGTRGGWALDLLIVKLAQELERARCDGGVVGILTHHLVHDDRAWRFLDELVEEIGPHPAIRWSSASELLKD